MHGCLRPVTPIFMNFKTSYAYIHRLPGLLVNLLLMLAAGMLILGLTMPVLSLEKLYFFGNTVSLLSGIQTLWREQEWGLAILLICFSVVFPALKILLLLMIWNLEATDSPAHQRNLHWLELYSKWSMLDVFVVALVVVSVKLGMMAEARVEPGVYAFAASVIITMLVSSWIGRYTRQGEGSAG